MTYTVRQLIEELEQYPDDAEVRLMEQESWPFEYSIYSVVARSDIQHADADGYLVDDDEPDPDPDPEADRKPPETVFICEGTQLCYGTKDAWGYR